MNLNMKNINFKNQIFVGVVIGAVIFIVIIAIYYFMFFTALETSLNQKKSSLNIVKIRYTSYLSEVKTYPALVKKQKKLDTEFLSLLTELPSKKNIPGLLMQVSNYAKALHLNLDMFKPGIVAPKSFYEEVPFSMNISGSFFNVYKFFYKLADMNRIVDVHNVAIAGNSSKHHQVAVSFEGTTFSFIGALPNFTADKIKYDKNIKYKTKSKISPMPAANKLKYKYKSNTNENNNINRNKNSNKQKIKKLKYKNLNINPYPYNLLRNPFRTFLYTQKPNMSFKYGEIPLLQYSLSSLHIVGIMERNGKYFAMVSTPNGRSYIVTAGSIMGVNRARIINITNNSIVLTEKTYNQIGQMHFINYVMSMK
ncbi:MAG: pilus assembly protein PilP [bacterium]